MLRRSAGEEEVEMGLSEDVKGARVAGGSAIDSEMMSRAVLRSAVGCVSEGW